MAAFCAHSNSTAHCSSYCSYGRPIPGLASISLGARGERHCLRDGGDKSRRIAVRSAALWPRCRARAELLLPGDPFRLGFKTGYPAGSAQGAPSGWPAPVPTTKGEADSGPGSTGTNRSRVVHTATCSVVSARVVPQNRNQEPVTKPPLKRFVVLTSLVCWCSMQSTVSSEWRTSQRRTSGQSGGLTSTSRPFYGNLMNPSIKNALATCVRTCAG